MIYIITDGLHFKIGKARNPETRLRELQTGNPRRLGIVCTWAKPIATPMENDEEIEWQDRLLELWLHAYLFAHRLTGEWFDGEAPKVRAIVELVKGEHFTDVHVLMAAARDEFIYERGLEVDQTSWDRWASDRNGRSTDVWKQFRQWAVAYRERKANDTAPSIS